MAEVMRINSRILAILSLEKPTSRSLGNIMPNMSKTTTASRNPTDGLTTSLNIITKVIAIKIRKKYTWASWGIITINI
jgi:hypothetical protein